MDNALPPNSIFTEASVRARTDVRGDLDLTSSQNVQAIAYALSGTAFLALVMILTLATVQQSIRIKSLLLGRSDDMGGPGAGPSPATNFLIVAKDSLPRQFFAENVLRYNVAGSTRNTQLLAVPGPASYAAKLPVGIARAADACGVSSTTDTMTTDHFDVVPMTIAAQDARESSARTPQCITVQVPTGRESLGHWVVATLSARGHQ